MKKILKKLDKNKIFKVEKFKGGLAPAVLSAISIDLTIENIIRAKNHLLEKYKNSNKIEKIKDFLLGRSLE